MDTKIKMLQLGVKQVDLIKMLNARGIKCAPCELNLAINGTGTQPKHKRIMEAVEEILAEIEQR